MSPRPRTRPRTKAELDDLDAAGVLWSCQTCGHECSVDEVFLTCPACGEQIDDDEALVDEP